MFKLIKYEFRKDIIIYLVIFAMILALEGYLMISILTGSDVNMVISIILYLLCGWGAVMVIMILGVVSFARELGSKYSFMTFMTPNSAYKIVGAKYITLIATTVLATAIYGGFIYLDVTVALLRYGDFRDIMDTINSFMTLMSGNSIADVVIALVAVLLGVWFNILLTVSYAYLATTLSYTILANKKGKVWLAVGLFVGIRVITSIITFVLPHFNFGEETLGAILAGSWLVYLFEFLFIGATYFVVSFLLDRKVSL